MLKYTRRPLNHDRRGAMLVLIAFCLPLVLIMAAFAIDVAWMMSSRDVSGSPVQ